MRRAQRGMRKAFTLVEMMIVVAIIAILAGMAVPQYNKYVKKSEATEAVRLMKQIADAEETYHSSHNKYVDDVKVLGIEVNDAGKFKHFKIKVCDGEKKGVIITSSMGTAAVEAAVASVEAVHMFYPRELNATNYDEDYYEGSTYLLDYVNGDVTDSKTPDCP